MSSFHDHGTVRIYETADGFEVFSPRFDLATREVLRSLKAIDRADVAVVLTDAGEGFTAQDAHVVGYVLEAGKGLVLVINKWDVVEKDEKTADDWLRSLRRDAPYLPGRPKGQWWKWKRDPHIIDAVLMYAQRGHGKRSSYYSDYTFGVWTGSEIGEELVPVGKAYFGFTDEELLQIDRFVRRNTTEKFGPVRHVVHEPDRGLVLEVAFEGLQRSSRHKSGVAMRFPRVNRLRWDKPPREADRLETLERMLKSEDANKPLLASDSR